MNGLIAHLTTGGYSIRRMAMDLDLNRKTVVRKQLFLGVRAQGIVRAENERKTPASEWEFDELITSEHTKCKPVSVIMAVEAKARRILGFKVARMPAHGPLGQISRARYGRRCDERRRKRRELFEEIESLVREDSLIKTDQCPHYTADIAKHFPHARHKTYKGRRGCVTGQGELKRGGRDPIFSLNHTFAMMRANINRLFRRTWCTTKRIDRLETHIALYVARHNLQLIHKKPARTSS